VNNGQNGEEGDVNMDDTEEESPMALHPLLMTEPGKTTTKSRERAIEMAMEGWDVPAFYLAKSGVLAAYVRSTCYSERY
jgi:actin-related protein 4